ncbi:MAG: BREX system P-loop protein BrxC, partial [bacterium]|nr:BREX system P-loop protein BrxC [bacterium]
MLEQALPEVFDRFDEAAAHVGKKDLESLMTTENLRRLGSVFTDLGLVRDQGGKPVFNTESGSLAEVLARIDNRTSYGEVASGRYLADEFAKEPFGWDFDVVRLLIVALLRAGKVEVTSKGLVIESALSRREKHFLSNNLFRQASFRLKVNETDMKDWADAAQAFEAAFGKAMPDISNAAVVASTIRSGVAEREIGVEDA